MVIFLLFLTLESTVGDHDRIQLGGTRPYYTVEDCRKDGEKMMNWLNQPDLNVEWSCKRVEKNGSKASTESVG